MTKVLVLYYSSFGHMEQMADAAADGARQVGAQAVVKRVPELVPEEVARNAQFKLHQAAPVAIIAPALNRPDWVCGGELDLGWVFPAVRASTTTKCCANSEEAPRNACQS